MKHNYEAVYHEEEPNERLAEWVVVHWDTTNKGNKFGHNVMKFGQFDEAEAKEMADRLNKNPIWIVVDNGDTFEGHQAHWADCFFSNAIESTIRHVLETEALFPGMDKSVFQIREMTDEELEKFPEAIPFREVLLKRYGEF